MAEVLSAGRDRRPGAPRLDWHRGDAQVAVSVGGRVHRDAGALPAVCVAREPAVDTQHAVWALRELLLEFLVNRHIQILARPTRVHLVARGGVVGHMSASGGTQGQMREGRAWKPCSFTKSGSVMRVA